MPIPTGTAVSPFLFCVARERPRLEILDADMIKPRMLNFRTMLVSIDLVEIVILTESCR